MTYVMTMICCWCVFYVVLRESSCIISYCIKMMNDECMLSNTYLTYIKTMIRFGTGMHIDVRKWTTLHISNDMWFGVCANDVNCCIYVPMIWIDVCVKGVKLIYVLVMYVLMIYDFEVYGEILLKECICAYLIFQTFLSFKMYLYTKIIWFITSSNYE